MLVSVESGKCLDTPGNQFANGTKEVLFTCDGSPGEVWNAGPNGELTQDGGQFCLDDTDWGTQNGSLAQIWPCHTNQANQEWILHRNGTITNNYAGTGLCLDVNAHGTADGTAIQLWSCNGGANQQWYWQ